jgi:hypothetical protein
MEFRERHGDERATPPERSVRRATARRASTRRATARQRKTDITARIIDYLKNHPQSTAGDVAKALNANRNTTATRLSQMVKKGSDHQGVEGLRRQVADRHPPFRSAAVANNTPYGKGTTVTAPAAPSTGSEAAGLDSLRERITSGRGRNIRSRPHPIRH